MYEIDYLKDKISNLESELSLARNQLVLLKQNREYSCSNCNQIHIEKNIILIESYKYHKSYSSYEDSTYSLINKFIICSKCGNWLDGKDIEYPIRKLRLCEEIGEIPDICKPHLEKLNKQREEETNKFYLERKLREAKKLLEDNGFEIKK